MNPRVLSPAVILLAGSLAAAAPGDLKSGPQPGARVLPFTSNAVTGPHRGKQHCYVCGLKGEPAVLVFARRLDEPTARLLRLVRDSVSANSSQKLFGWFVFLGGDSTASETELERQAYDFARRNGATRVPICVLGDPQGPPGYLIAPEAEVTLLLIRSGKVVVNRAFRAEDWTARAADGALRDLPRLLAAPAGG